MKTSHKITIVHLIITVILIFLTFLFIISKSNTYESIIFVAMMLLISSWYFNKYKVEVGKILTAIDKLF